MRRNVRRCARCLEPVFRRSNSTGFLNAPSALPWLRGRVTVPRQLESIYSGIQRLYFGRYIERFDGGQYFAVHVQHEC
jgi:hypothetical protein